MRLINTVTLEMKEFFDDSLPPYAILSHTWGSDEVSFQDWQAVANFPALLEASRPFSERLGVMDPFTALQQANVHAITNRAGYQKILGFCRAVRDWNYSMFYGVEVTYWAWVDTCCIDKKSSAELSEAINSMFRWYKKSEMCLVYLSDVPGDTQPPFLPDSNFCKSRWFSRGWTLQELLAPSIRRFYDQDWKPIGWISEYCIFQESQEGEASQMERSVVSTVAQVTGIPADVISLRDFRGGIRDASVSAKMSWLSKRETTRKEDRAYCMLGIFGVHMPLLYGEGDQAFTRLQEEIIKVSVDHTIFARRYGADVPDNSLDKTDFDKLLAESPSDFVRGSQLVSSHFGSASMSKVTGSFQMTNRGLQIRLPILLLKSPGGELNNLYYALLNCVEVSGQGITGHESWPSQQALALPLVKDDISSGTLDDDATLKPIKGGVPVPVSLPPQSGTSCFSLITRRIFIPRSISVHHQEPRSREDVILRLENRAPIGTGTPWTVAEVFPPLVNAWTMPWKTFTLADFQKLSSECLFGLRDKENRSKDARATLPHFFRLRGYSDLVLAVEIERHLEPEHSREVRICLSAMPQQPQESLLGEFLNGALDRGSKRCEWHMLVDGIPKRLNVGGFEYVVWFDSTKPPILPPPLELGGPTSIFLTSVPTNPTSSEKMDLLSND